MSPARLWAVWATLVLLAGAVIVWFGAADLRGWIPAPGDPEVTGTLKSVVQGRWPLAWCVPGTIGRDVSDFSEAGSATMEVLTCHSYWGALRVAGAAMLLAVAPLLIVLRRRRV